MIVGIWTSLALNFLVTFVLTLNIFSVVHWISPAISSTLDFLRARYIMFLAKFVSPKSLHLVINVAFFIIYKTLNPIWARMFANRSRMFPHLLPNALFWDKQILLKTKRYMTNTLQKCNGGDIVGDILWDTKNKFKVSVKVTRKLRAWTSVIHSAPVIKLSIKIF